MCQDLGRLNLPVTVSTPEEFTEKGLGPDTLFRDVAISGNIFLYFFIKFPVSTSLVTAESDSNRVWLQPSLVTAEFGLFPSTQPWVPAV